MAGGSESEVGAVATFGLSGGTADLDGSCLARIRIDVGNADYDKAIDSVIPHVFQEKDAHTVLGGDYAGSGNLQEVMQFMHNAPTAAKKEFYIVKTLSVEKETIARNFENSAASQGVVEVCVFS